MTINPTKLTAATAGLWALFALPIAAGMPDAHHLPFFVFWYAVLMYPVWVVYGWRWISDGTSVPLKVWVPLVLLALPLSLLIADAKWYSYISPETAWIPSVTSVALVLMTGSSNGWNAFQGEVKGALLALYRKPPVWLVFIIVLLASMLVQELTGLYYPPANFAMLAGAVLAWMVPHVIRRWNLSSDIAWAVVLMLVLLIGYAYH